MGIETALVFILWFAWGRLMATDFLTPFLDHSGGILAVYLVAFIGIAGYLWLSQNERSDRIFRWTAVVSIILIVLTGSWQTNKRFSTAPKTIHDGAMQTEEAARFLLQGSNPYEADFRATPFGMFGSPYPGSEVNVAWTHYAYPPAMVISTVPFILLEEVLDLRIDTRWMYVLFLVVLWIALMTVVHSQSGRVMVTLLTIGNPLLALYAIAGFNDIVASTMIVIAAIMLSRRKWVWAGIAFGAAVGLKQTTWLLLPLWGIYLFSMRPAIPLRKTVLAFVLTAGTLYAPFLFWNAPALYDDVVRYVSGSLPQTYAISGSTFLQYLHVFGIVPSAWSPLPTPWIQLAVGIPALAVAAAWIRRRPTPSTFLHGSAFAILAVALFSRFFYDNYAAGILALVVAGTLLHQYGKNQA